MDQRTIDTYNKMAVEYDAETVDFWDRFPRTFLDRFIAETQHQTTPSVQAKVLNIGSGPGRDGLLLKEQGIDVMCLDASEAMVELSSKRGLNSLVGDFNELSFEDESVDGIWAYTSLLHVPRTDISTPLKEIYRVLKKEGYLALGMIEGEGEMYRESSGVSRERWFSFYTQEEIETLLRDHGFKIVYFETFKPRNKNYLNFIAQKI